jgi:hypothetical protein
MAYPRRICALKILIHRLHLHLIRRLIQELKAFETREEEPITTRVFMKKNYFPPSLKPIVLMAPINRCRITFNNDLKQSDILPKKFYS